MCGKDSTGKGAGRQQETRQENGRVMTQVFEAPFKSIGLEFGGLMQIRNPSAGEGRAAAQHVKALKLIPALLRK